jgi:lipopolysaccharide/colanic/teichoic acid biosynthesis glycosyltransferase
MLSQARRELLESLNIPMSKADVTQLKKQQQQRITSWERNMKQLLFVKRMLDILISGTAILVASPFFLIVAICIYVENPGPVFYMQTRVGLNGRTFPFYKFRSMVMNADQMKDELLAQNESEGGVIFKMKKDPRVTRTGRFIRRFSIDEMPQFLNVLLGDLSIVGPRPPVPREVAEYTLEDRKRLHVKPGLTCFWQIQGRSEIPFDEQVRLDLQYIRSSGPLSDLAIMFKTVPAVLFGKGAY